MLLVPDSRKRVSLAPFAKHDLYLVHAEEDGTIVMVPAEVMPVTELEKLKEK